MKNETTRFLKKAKTGMQSNIDIEEIILDQLKLEKTADDIAYELEQYGIDYYDALDRVENVVDTLYTRFSEEDKNADLLEGIEEEEVEPVKKAPLYSLNDQWASEDPSFDEFDDEVEDDIQQEEEDDQDQEEEENFNVKKQGGTIGKKKFVKNIVRGLKKAAEGVEQEESFQATILDKPIKGRATLKNNFKRGIKDLGNEYYAKEIYNKTQALQNEVQQLPTGPTGMMRGQDGMEMQQDMENPMHHYNAYADSVSNIFKQPMNQVDSVGFGNIPEARRGREQRQSDRQQRQMSKDFNNAFGDVAAGYFGVPGMPNYLQMVNVVDPSVMAKNKETPEPSKFPGIDFEYNKGPWWSGKRSWSAKGIPAEMLMGSGRNLNYGNQNFGYGNNTYGSSWSKSYSYPGEIIKHKAAVINSAADPGKTNTVELKNNPTVTPDVNAKPFDIRPGILADLYPNGMPPITTGADLVVDPGSNIALPEFNTVNPVSNIPEEANLVPNSSEPFSSQEYLEDEYGDIGPEINLDSNNENYDAMYPFDPANSKGIAYHVGSEDVNTSFDDFMKTNPSKEDIDKEVGWRLGRKNRDLDRNVYPYNYDYNLLSPKTSGDGRYGDDIDYQYVPENAYGGYIDSQNPDLYKFVYGGDDEYEDYSNNYANSKNVEDPYMRDGGLYKAQYGQSESYDSNAPDFANREAYNAAVANNLTNEAYNPKTTYTGVNSNYSKANNSKTGTLNSSSNTGNGYQVGDQIRSDGSVWRGNTQISDGKDAISENNSNTQNRNVYQGYPTALPIKNQIWNALGKNLKVFNKDFTWASQDGPLRDGSGNPISMPNSFSNATKDQAGFVQDYKYEKGPWWKGNKQSLEVKNRYFDPKNPTGSTNSFADGKGPVANPAASGANPSAPGVSSDAQDVKKFQDSQTAQGKVWDDQKQRWVNSGYNPTATSPGYSGYNADSEGNNIPDYLQPGVMSGSNPATKPVGPTLAYGGYMDFGGYVPEFDPGGQFDGTGPFDPNDSGIAGGGTGPCTEEQVKNAKLGDPCYNEAYSNKIPQDFTAKYKLNDAKTMNTAAIANIGQVAGLATQGVSDLQNNIYNQDYFNSNISYSGNRVPTTYTDNAGGVSGQDQRGVGAPRFTGVVGANAYSKKGGELSYQKGGVYDLSQEEIGQILAAGGQIKFIK